MKTVQFEIGGIATTDNVLSISYSAKRGGKTSASHQVYPNQTLEDITQGLVFAINTHWCKPLFDARKTGETTLMVICSDGADDVSFSWQCEHINGPNHLYLADGGDLTVGIKED